MHRKGSGGLEGEKKVKKNVSLSKLLRIVLQKSSIAERIGCYNRCLAIHEKKMYKKPSTNCSIGCKLLGTSYATLSCKWFQFASYTHTTQANAHRNRPIFSIQKPLNAISIRTSDCTAHSSRYVFNEIF